VHGMSAFLMFAWGREIAEFPVCSITASWGIYKDWNHGYPVFSNHYNDWAVKSALETIKSVAVHCGCILTLKDIKWFEQSWQYNAYMIIVHVCVLSLFWYMNLRNSFGFSEDWSPFCLTVY
jgi:hypothetical protein